MKKQQTRFTKENEKVTAKLNAIELANPKTAAPKKNAANGATETTMLKTDTSILSNLAILNALFVSSSSFWASLPG